MKVSTLIDRLQALNPDALVVMSSDEEGNSYSPLATTYEVNYVAESTWSGWLVGNKEDYDEDNEDEYEEDLEASVPAVVLYPTR